MPSRKLRGAGLSLRIEGVECLFETPSCPKTELSKLSFYLIHAIIRHVELAVGRDFLLQNEALEEESRDLKQTVSIK